MERMTLSKLRANLYRIVDTVILSGRGVEIERRGRRVRIVSANEGDALDQLKPHPDYLQTDPEALVHMDWSQEWHP
ncbi:hypothetical protein NB231_02538 [Nitrococcus mobilis Nb-231]|uniref:Antitoxin n=2 Tax=Nitrococcus mobilis TaxID=35797 RepID=A4BRN7_9GAMM|nr:hypothetical protein NB231_02538 [Nitrococcus mobilis Nb-231]